MTSSLSIGSRSRVLAAAAACVALVVVTCAERTARQPYTTFDTPEDAVHALNTAVATGNLDDVRALFGPDSQDLIDESDPVTARQNREVYAAAVKQGWRLVDAGSRKELVVGNEAWPFPVPLAKHGERWRFDTAAGKEEVLVRRIGRNELSAIQACHAYVAAQRQYARAGHDGKPAGRYARTFRSDAGRHNGLYWPAAPGHPRSPLGDLLSAATAPAAARTRDPAPFHGYYFRILRSQGDAAPGGARDYVVHGELSGGFALVAWPAFYERTGIMTFIVNHDGLVHEKDLGPATDGAASGMAVYDPDDSWSPVHGRGWR